MGKLKGRSIIELTDINTGISTKYENDNMLTNAIADIANFRAGDITASLSKIMPLNTQGMAGLLCFPEPIEENVNTIFAPVSNVPTGYASNNTNSTTDTKRGSLNLTESGAIDNGYQFVWDFATSQGNGPISALALTHANGGVNYFGSSQYGEYAALSIGTSSLTTNGVYLQNMIEVDFENSIFYTVIPTATGFNICKCYYPFTKIMGVTASQNVKVLETHSFASSVFYTYEGVAYNSRFVDGKNGYWYGFKCGGNSSGNATINVIKISKADYSKTDETWTLTGAKLSMFGYIRSIISLGQNNSIALLNGKLYALNYALNGLYIIDIASPSTYELIPLGVTAGYYNGTPCAYLVEFCGYIRGYNWIFNPVTKAVTVIANPSVTPNSSLSISTAACQIFSKDNIMLHVRGSSGSTVYIECFIITPYLATINNLDVAVTKTAAMTMKITYILTDTAV